MKLGILFSGGKDSYLAITTGADRNICQAAEWAYKKAGGK